MSRMARVVVPGLPHHVTQRGNRRAAVFVDDADRMAYRHSVIHHFARQGLKVWAYCLMTNHVHFVVVPEHERSLANAFRDAHTNYALGFNRRHGLNGHLWQGRFFSTPLDAEHLWTAVRYVERNPVRAGMIVHAEEYRWSSAAAHVTGVSDGLLSADFPPPGVIADWREWLATQPEEEVSRVRRSTHTGRPCGSRGFVTQLEELLGRALHPQKPGPKPKPMDNDTGMLWS